MTDLVYHPGAMVEDLALNQCVIRSATNGTSRWWHLWFYVGRETDGVPEAFEVAVNPGGPYMEGPGGHTWGLNCSSPGIWQISPSIKVPNDEDARKYIATGEPPTGKDIWHQTPRIVNVPPSEPWASGVAP